MTLKLSGRIKPLFRIGIQTVCPFSNHARSSTAARALCISSHGLRKPLSDWGVSSPFREPNIVSYGKGDCFRRSFFQFRVSPSHQPSEDEERSFQQSLRSCNSSQEVFNLLCSLEILSDTMAAAALHRVADFEQNGHSLQNPSVLDNDTIRCLCFQLEQEYGQLTDAGLSSALLACTRLFLDPWSTLMVRLVSENQRRLEGGKMKVGQLCTIGEAMLAVEGPGCVILHQVLEEIQKQESADWNVADAVSVYKLLQDSAADDAYYTDLMNAVQSHSLHDVSELDPAMVSVLLNKLVTVDKHKDNFKPVVINLCKQAVRHLPQFTDKELTLVLGALIHFGHSDDYLVEAMEKYVPTVGFTAHPETVAKVMQFFSRRNIWCPPVFDAVAESFVYRADEYSASQVTRQIMAFGKLGYLPPNAGNMFKKVEEILHTRFLQFKPRTVLNLLHACTLVQRFPVNFVSRVFTRDFIQQLQENGRDQFVQAQLTQLYMTLRLECPFYKGPHLLQKHQVKSFSLPGRSLETSVDAKLHGFVVAGLTKLLGSCLYFGSGVLTPYCYTLDVEIKLDTEGQVLHVHENTGVKKRIALCIDGKSRFAANARQLLGKEIIKQRHLRILGYEVVQIPYYEIEELPNMSSVVKYLHQKIFST